VIIAAIFALIITYIVYNWNKDRLSALLFVPYAMWVGFASTLNLSIAILN
jgi:tryptophan-rich sensory protein